MSLDALEIALSDSRISPVMAEAVRDVLVRGMTQAEAVRARGIPHRQQLSLTIGKLRKKLGLVRRVAYIKDGGNSP